MLSDEMQQFKKHVDVRESILSRLQAYQDTFHVDNQTLVMQLNAVLAKAPEIPIPKELTFFKEALEKPESAFSTSAFKNAPDINEVVRDTISEFRNSLSSDQPIPISVPLYDLFAAVFRRNSQIIEQEEKAEEQSGTEEAPQKGSFSR